VFINLVGSTSAWKLLDILPPPLFDWIFIGLCVLLTQAHWFNWVSIGLWILAAQARRKRLSSCVWHTAVPAWRYTSFHLLIYIESADASSIFFYMYFFRWAPPGIHLLHWNLFTWNFPSNSFVKTDCLETKI
jgi:hypothetical protein